MRDFADPLVSLDEAGSGFYAVDRSVRALIVIAKKRSDYTQGDHLAAKEP